MSLDGTINAYFLRNISAESSEYNDKLSKVFSESLDLLRNHLPKCKVKEINENEAIELIAAGGLTKKDVFVLERFEGDAFKQLQCTKSLIVGPPCIVECLQKGEPIPLGTSPVYATTMHNLQICASGLTMDEKERLRTLVQWMGGHYFKNFSRSITHLVANTVISIKYEHATHSGIPVMHPDWVNKLWKQVIADRSIARPSHFNQHLLPVFYGLNVTCTGLTAADKKRVINLITENGGVYHGAFRSNGVDIVIVAENQLGSDKYKAAVRYKKDIVLYSWVFDSCDKGYAVPLAKYRVRPRKLVSTPTKSLSSVADQSQLSELSRISFISTAKNMVNNLTTVEDTMSSSTITSAPSQAVAVAAGMEFDFSSNSVAKITENFMVGCCVYLHGFTTNQQAKLVRLLNMAGAVHCEHLGEMIVTHIIMEQFEQKTYLAWKSAGLATNIKLVNLNWLLDSVKDGQLVCEKDYCFQQEASAASVASLASSCKKNALAAMKRCFIEECALMKKAALATLKDNDNDAWPGRESTLSKTAGESLLLTPKPLASSTQFNKQRCSEGGNTEAYDKLSYFKDTTVYVYEKHFLGEYYLQMVHECEAAQANVVPRTFRDAVDYAIVSFENALNVDELPVKACHIITELYVECCMKANMLIPIEYYHKFIPHTVNTKPLGGLTVVVSIYSGMERDFIDSLSHLLGANVNKTYVRKEKPLLICSAPEGSKYEGAIKWGFPIVTSAWLLLCAETGTKVPYTDFLVGNSVESFTVKSLPSLNMLPTAAAAVAEENINKNSAASKKTVSLEFTPLRSKRVLMLAEGEGASSAKSLATAPDTPRTPINNYARATYNFDFMEEILSTFENEEERICVQEIINDLRGNQTPELERIKQQACTPINRITKLLPKGLPAFCLTPEYQKRFAADFKTRWHLPINQIKPETPLEEIRKRVLRITCDSLGIPYNFEKELDNQELEELAKHAEPKLVNEGDFEATKSNEERNNAATSSATSSILHESNKELEVEAQAQAELVKTNVTSMQKTKVKPCQLLAGSSISLDAIGFDDSFDGIDEQRTSITSTSPEIKLITEYLHNNEQRRTSLLRFNGDENYADRASRLAMAHTESEMHYVQPFESEQIGRNTQELVGWRDIAGFSTAERPRSFQKMQFEGKPCFSISGCEDQRSEVTDIIIKLGGEVCQNLTGFDPSCTHFLCEKPNRGEKMLCYVAAGKWILSVKYIEECHAKDAFIDEELFEWGNCKALNMPDLTEDERQIAQAAHRWRVKLSSADSIKGAFSGFIVLLHISDRRSNAIKNVITSGKGLILDINPPFNLKNKANTATHCFIDPKRIALRPADYKFLKKHGVQILSQLYINAYLMYGADVDSEKYVIEA